MKYYSDGFLIGRNPATEGGYTIVDENNKLIEETLLDQDKVTNNDAEFQGVFRALKIAELKDIISTDSMCILTWVNSGRSKARPDLNEQLREARGLMKEKGVYVIWEPRGLNLAGIFNEENHDRMTEDYLPLTEEQEQQQNHLLSINPKGI